MTLKLEAPASPLEIIDYQYFHNVAFEMPTYVGGKYDIVGRKTKNQ